MRKLFGRKPKKHSNTTYILQIPPSAKPARHTSSMANSFTAHELKSWIDEIPNHLLSYSASNPFPTSHPIYADANCRLVVQDKMQDAYILRVSISPTCTDPVLAAFKQMDPGAVPAWCAVPRDGSMTAEAVYVALKKTVQE